MSELATVADLAAAGIDTTDEVSVKARLRAATLTVLAALRGCVYDPEDTAFRQVARDAVVAQVAAMAAYGITPGQPIRPVVVSSKSLQSASVSYADATALTGDGARLRTGGLAPGAQAVLEIAGLAPYVTTRG